MKQDLQGRVFVITGANTGIGKVTALEIAKTGATLILACRSEKKALPVVEELKQVTGNQEIRFVPLDLASLESVRKCAKQILEEEPKIHVLINNAGLASMRGETQEGFELAFGVNHLGHFLFTKLLLPRLQESTPARIVNVASRAHKRVKKYSLDDVQKYTQSTSGFPEYCLSKLANVLFNNELAKRIEGTDVTCYALHPGVVASDIWRRIPIPFRWIAKMFMISNEEGALTSLHCALSEEAGKESGLYYDKCKAIPTQHPAAKDDALAKELWDKSEEWVAPFAHLD